MQEKITYVYGFCQKMSQILQHVHLFDAMWLSGSNVLPGNWKASLCGRYVPASTDHPDHSPGINFRTCIWNYGNSLVYAVGRYALLPDFLSNFKGEMEVNIFFAYPERRQSVACGILPRVLRWILIRS